MEWSKFGVVAKTSSRLDTDPHKFPRMDGTKLSSNNGAVTSPQPRPTA